jgi:outer membrane lipoprotein-sorting protein
MMTIASQADGTYKVASNNLSMTGTLKGKVDDGYKKDDINRPFSMTANIEKGTLIVTDMPVDDHCFRKEGTGPPTLPGKYKLKVSDSSAVTMLKGVEKVYASMKTFSATGTVESNGGGFAPKKAKFKVLFESPSKFRFEASVLDGDKEYDRTEISWSGGDKCWWYTKEFGEHTDRSLSNALRISMVSFGAEADFLPDLLLPHAMNSESLTKTYPEVTFLPNEVINSQKCMVFQLRSKGADVTKLWVAESTGLIVRYFDGIRGETILIDSQVDKPIDPKAFNFGKRS